MDKPSIDWSKFTLKIGISADPIEIFNLWTSQDGIESWFLSKAEFSDSNGKLKSSEKRIAKDDTYTWMWHTSDNIENGKVLNIETPNSLSFTFLSCDVLVKLYEEAGETIVELEQSNIPTDDAFKASHYVGCTRGWTFYLANLKSVLEGGNDLRNRNEELERVLNT